MSVASALVARREERDLFLFFLSWHPSPDFFCESEFSSRIKDCLKRNGIKSFYPFKFFFWRFLIVAFPFLYLISLPMNSKKKPWDTALNRTATYTPIKQSGFSSGNRPNNRHSITSLSSPSPLVSYAVFLRRPDNDFPKFADCKAAFSPPPPRP